jgi:hypothetical protein
VNDYPYTTKHFGFAAFLRYALGDEAHVSTIRFEHGIGLSFDDPDNRCVELQKAFFSEEGAAVGDARALLDCNREITNTIFEAKRNESWERAA